MSFEFLGKGFDPVICLCECADLAMAIRLAEKLSDNTDIIQLFDADEKILNRVVPAFLNAALRNYEDCMRTRSLRSEMLLFASGKLDIKQAIGSCGARGNRFIAFSNSRKLLAEFAEKGKIRIVTRYKPILDFEAAEKVSSTELLGE